jgi:hypothetical protein
LTENKKIKGLGLKTSSTLKIEKREKVYKIPFSKNYVAYGNSLIYKLIPAYVNKGLEEIEVYTLRGELKNKFTTQISLKNIEESLGYGILLDIAPQDELFILYDPRGMKWIKNPSLEIHKYNHKGLLLSKIKMPINYWADTNDIIKLDKFSRIYQLFTQKEGIYIIRWEPLLY